MTAPPSEVLVNNQDSFKATKMLLYRRMLYLQCSAKMSNLNVSNEVNIQRKPSANQRKKQSKYLAMLKREKSLL